MPRPQTYEQLWAKYAQRGLSTGGLGESGDPWAADDEEPEDYARDQLRSYLEGSPAARVYLNDDASKPVHRMSGRAATKSLAKHRAAVSELEAFALDHLRTVTSALQAYSPGPTPGATSSAGVATTAGSKSATPGVVWGSSDEDSESAARGGVGAGASPRLHPPSCDCRACGDRAARRSSAVDVLSHYGDFMAMNSERLHRALAEPNPLELLTPRAAGTASLPATPGGPRSLYPRGAAASYQASPDGDLAAEQQQLTGSETETDDEQDEQRVPCYVLRRYSEVSGLRDKTLGRVVRALAAEEARPAFCRAASRPGGPLPLDALGDRRLSLLVTGAEMGEHLPGGKRRPLAERLAEATSDRLDAARAREVDPDEDSEEGEEAARGGARRRSHAAVLREVRAASSGGAAARGAKVSAPEFVRVKGRESALASRLSAGGAAVPSPRRSGPAAAAAGTRSAGGARSRGVGPDEVQVARGAWSDSSEDEYARRMTDAGAGMGSQRMRVDEAMGHTLRSLGGGAPGAAGAVAGEARRASSAAGSSPAGAATTAASGTRGSGVAGWYMTASMEEGSEGEAQQQGVGRRATQEARTEEQPTPRRESLSAAWEQRAKRSLSLGGSLTPQVATPRTRTKAGSPSPSPLSAQQPALRSASSVGSTVRRLTFADHVEPTAATPRTAPATPRSPTVSAAGAAAGRLEATRRRSEVAAVQLKALSQGYETLTTDELRLLSAAAHGPPAAPGAPRSTWAPTSDAAAAAGAGAGAGEGGVYGGLASRISAPADRPLSARGQGRSTAGGGGAGAKDGWAQQVYARVSTAGGAAV